MTGEPTLEQALDRLDEIARRLEGDEMELSEALALYEEGVGLLRVADAALGAAEERIQQLSPEGDGHRLEPLD